MPAPIIAAYDPYVEDRAPVTLALAAARLAGAPVIAVSVAPWLIEQGYRSVDDFERVPDLAASGALARLRAELGLDTLMLHDLSVPHGLHALARDRHCGLIVVGSTDRGPVGRVLMGSTAERLLHGSPCPVALAPRGYVPAEPATIAVGFVDTPEGNDALLAGHALALRSHATLRVVAVLNPARGAMLEGRRREEVSAALQLALGALDRGVEIEYDIHVGDPADALLRVSQHVDLLVCGSRGYGPLRSVLLGGVSRRLVDEARCPVLVLPRDAERPLEDLLHGADTAAVR